MFETPTIRHSGEPTPGERPDGHPSGRRGPAALQERGWWAPTRAEHPLGRLQGRSLDKGRLLALLGSKNSVGARYFQLFLSLPDGRISDPFLLGLHNSGRFPAFNWIDVARYDGAASFAGGDEIALAGAPERRLFRLLGDLIPPGGHLMLEYESAHARSTERMLSLGLPPVTTPLGYLVFLAGCGASFRDWYISEGGREGPRRLQGFKPLDAATAAEKAAAMATELRALLTAPPNKERREWEAPARGLARRVLARLDKRTTPA
jgi:hypothetical protein